MAGIVVRNDNTRLFLWQEAEGAIYPAVGSSASADAKMIARARRAKIANITEIGDVGGESDEIDVTTIDSIGNEYEPGTVDNGTISMTLNIVNQADYVRFLGIKQSGVEFNWAISSWNKLGQQVIGISGKGYLSSATLTGITNGGILQVSAGIRVNGEVNPGFVDVLGAGGSNTLQSIVLTGPDLGGSATAPTLTMKVGESVGLGVLFNPENVANRTINWSVGASGTASEDNTAAVNFMGVVTALAEGSTTVVATPVADPTKKVSVAITVEGDSVE